MVGRLFLALFFELLTAPLWWYSGGMIWILKQAQSSISNTSQSAGLGLWVRNLFVPMYGQYDVWGRIVSFIIRFANIIARSLWVAVWAVLCLAVVAVWAAAPAIVFYLFILSLLNLFQ